MHCTAQKLCQVYPKLSHQTPEGLDLKTQRSTIKDKLYANAVYEQLIILWVGKHSIYQNVPAFICVEGGRGRRARLEPLMFNEKETGFPYETT